MTLTTTQHRRLRGQSPGARPVVLRMISLSWKLLSLYSSFKVPGRTWPQCFSRAGAAGAALVDPLHPSRLSLSSWANRANCVLLEGPCCLWAGFGDLQGSLLLLMHQRGCFPTQDIQCASCECLSALLELSLGPVCGTWELNPRVWLLWKL